MLLKITFKDGDVVSLQNVVSIVHTKHPVLGDGYSIVHSGMDVEYNVVDVQEIVIGG